MRSVKPSSEMRKHQGFCFSDAMKTQALESYLYGDPSKVLEIRQSQQANAAKRAAERPAAKRPILTLKSRKTDGEWSEARKAAEALFTPPQPVREL